MSLDQRFTLSQKVAFQLEEQLQLAFQENQKLHKAIAELKYEMNHMRDELYVAGKRVEQREGVIAALSARYDGEYAQFEDKIMDAVYAKDKQIAEMQEQIDLQRAHADELEKELEAASRESLTQERMLRDTRAERD